ncbi:MAG: PQQ-binding-like beta-propeller repeat protein [Ignavibacteriales bacterium]|nr:PQQ-binding-like beta-propeller repeat protein [Ignavibacteriales bacterium]
MKATDDNFDGFAEAEVSGINSYVFNDTLIDIKWMRGSEEIASGISATLTLPSGTNEITAKAILTSGNDVSKKFAISVAAVWTTVSGEVNSSFTQAGDGRYIYTSSNKNIYLVDSTATISAAYLTGGVINSSVAVSPANLVFAGAMDARVYAFDLSLNSIWDKSIGGEISTTPSISHDNATLYITTNNGMLRQLIH